MRLALFSWCLFLTAGNAAADGDSVFEAPGVGRIFADASITPRRDDRLARVRFRDEQGSELLVLQFRQFGPGDVTFQSSTGRDLPTPSVFVASSFARADGVNVDLVAVGVVDGVLRKLFVFADRDLEDAVCIAPDARSGSLRVILARFLEGHYCFMCWPKRFEVQTYRWDEGRLKVVRRRRTRRLHSDWSSALGEEGVQCEKEVLQSTVLPTRPAHQAKEPESVLER